MSKLRRKVYMAAGYNTISLGTGRSEFNPKKTRPGLEHYIKEAGQVTLGKIGGAKNVDESAIGNFMASRFNKQGHLAGFIPMIDDGLQYKPSIRTEGACASGALALMSGMKSVLAETAEVVLTVGVEVQNTIKLFMVLMFWQVPDGSRTEKKAMPIFSPDSLVTEPKRITINMVWNMPVLECDNGL